MRPQIAGPLSVHEIYTLSDLAASSGATAALEVGHYLGLSTAVLLCSLPEACELVTIDHHLGDDWCPATSIDEFQANIAPHLGERAFTFLNADMRDALPALDGEFDFVFYDADHTAAAVADFWDLAQGLLADDCTLVFDDADWAEQSTLRRLAESAGFEVVTAEPFVRYDDDKRDPRTYTLEIMERVA